MRPDLIILTGAGISAESGIGTFRGPGGLWENHRVEDVCTPQALARDPVLVHRFYDWRRATVAQATPNAAHAALARLEDAWVAGEGGFTLVTQNVDDLHERAGSRALIHMHGQHATALCAACAARVPRSGPMPAGTVCPQCGEPALRPDIVFFGELPYHLAAIDAALRRCRLFVSIGTSGAVWPAAGFVRIARGQGARTVELNLERSAGSDWFDESRRGPATTLVPAWVDEMLAAQ